MPIVLGGPWTGGFFGVAGLNVAAESSTLRQRPSSFSLNGSPYTWSEQTSNQIVVFRAGTIAHTESIDWFMSGVPATPSSGTITFLPFATLGIISVVIGPVSGNQVGSVTLTNPQQLSGGAPYVPTLGSPSTSVLTILDVDPEEPTATAFYFATTGNDTTGNGTIGNPWRTVAKANTIVPIPGVHTDLLFSAGDYRNDPISPANSGTSPTSMLRYGLKPLESGLAWLKGPTPSGTMANAIDLTAGQDYIHVMAGIGIDGEPDPYPASPKDTASIDKWLNMGGTNRFCIIEPSIVRGTKAFEAADVTGDHNIIRVGELSLCGTPNGAEPQPDRDDGITLKGSYHLVEGTRYHSIGHYQIAVNDIGFNIVRHTTHVCNWTESGWINTVDGGPLGNHGVSFNTQKPGPFPTNTVYEDGIYKIAERHYNDTNKTQLRNSKLIDLAGNFCLLRNGFCFEGSENGVSIAASASNGPEINDARIAHMVFANLDGAAILTLTSGIGTQTRRLQIKNCVFFNCSRQNTQGTNQYLRFESHQNPGGSLDGLIVTGNYFPAGAMVYARNFTPSERTIEQWQIDRPDVFFGNIIGAPQLVNPAASTEFNNVYSRFALVPGSPGINAGVRLTQATNSGTGAVALSVADPLWFIDNRGHPNQKYGPHAGMRYQIMVGTQQRGIVSVVGSVVTLDATTTWSVGTPINYAFSGSAPNCGAVQ